MNEPVNKAVAERITLFADILLPVPVPNYYTYRVPYEWNDLVQKGVRVIVQFGPKKILTGVVININNRPPENYEVKYILDILDDRPVVTHQQFAFFNWLAHYYMCTEGQVLQVALPSGLKLSSQSKLQLNPGYQRDQPLYPLSQEEEQIVHLLETMGTLDFTALQEQVEFSNPHRWVKSLLKKNAILLFEEVKEKYRPKKEKIVKLREQYRDQLQLEALLQEIQKSKKQTEIILRYLQLTRKSNSTQSYFPKSALLATGVSRSSLKTLIKKGIFEEAEKVVSRFPATESVETLEFKLSEAQTRARDSILLGFQKHQIGLLHGVTGSGKTEVYMDLALKVLDTGGQVLYLLPEIALTTQIVTRLKKVFGDKMGVYHSKFSGNERVEVWQGVLDGKFSIVVGVRSSVFLPFDNLALVIIDEEHESSYKQFDPAPRYHARDAALMLARIHHAKTLLGSATPSVESYYQALEGKYALISLKERYGLAALPQYQLVDISKKDHSQIFSNELIEAINTALMDNLQVIIFQNRRGYAPFLQCETCGYIPQCINCAVSLTYHLHSHRLSCHYCGAHYKMPTLCDHCGSSHQDLKGYGTEKLEEKIKKRFPQAQVQRMDLDTTRRKYGYQKIIQEFENGEIDILVGTQMVTKGLDFHKVDLVGVLDIDRIIHYPDFRSHERAFQLISQVGGRAGRKSGKGLVLIQSKNPRHPLLQLVMDQDYTKFYQQEIAERLRYSYPPYIRLIRLTIKSKERELAQQGAGEVYNLLVNGLGNKRVLGPHEPGISKIRNEYLMQVFIKLEKKSRLLNSAKSNINEMILHLNQRKKYRKLKIIADVDPI